MRAEWQNLAVMIATVMIAAQAGAATNAVTELPPIIVEASRINLSDAEMPGAVHVIGEQELAASGAQQLVDVLEKSAPELHLRRMGGANPAMAEVAMRGYGESGHGRTLVLAAGRTFTFAVRYEF